MALMSGKIGPLGDAARVAAEATDTSQRKVQSS